MWPQYSGAPEARGPRLIEPPKPPVPTPLFLDTDLLSFFLNFYSGITAPLSFAKQQFIDNDNEDR